MADISAKTRIDATPEQVWEVLSDFGGICRATPHITDSSITSDQAGGIGASRHCDVDMPGVTAEEVVTRWEEGRGYGFDMHMKGMPVRNAHAEFDISTEANRSVLTGTVSYELPFGILGRAMDKFVSRRMGAMLAGTLAGFKERVESGAEISKHTKLATSEVEIA